MCGTGLDVTVVEQPGVEPGPEVIQTWESGKERCGAGMLLIDIWHGCAEVIDRMLAAPVAAVIAAKEHDILEGVLICLAQGTEALYLEVIRVLGFQYYAAVVRDALTLAAVVEIQQRVSDRQVLLVLYESVADDWNTGALKADADVKHLGTAVKLGGKVDTLAAGGEGQKAHPPGAGCQEGKGVV